MNMHYNAEPSEQQSIFSTKILITNYCYFENFPIYNIYVNFTFEILQVLTVSPQS